MPASRTYVGEMDVQLLTTIVSPNQDTSTLFRAAMHRVLDSRLGMLERQCQASSIKARSRFTIFLKRSSFIPPNPCLQGLRMCCACALLRACALSFDLWTSKRSHRGSYYVFTVLSGIAHVHCSAHAQFHFDFGSRREHIAPACYGSPLRCRILLPSSRRFI